MSGETSAVSVAGLVRTYGARRAVDGVSLEVPQGSIYGLIGPNGAGKTTTFSVLCGLLSYDAGTVRVLGQDPRELWRLKGRVGALPQDALLPANDAVGALLMFYGRLAGLPGSAVEAAAKDALKQVGLAEIWYLRAGQLSHGMARRVGLAQAMLIGDPELVLLDEPTAGLDPKSAAQVREFIQALHARGGAKRTVIISSHNLVELESMCDRAAILDKGKVVTQGTMEEITEQTKEVRFELGQEPVLAPLKGLPGVGEARWEAERQLLIVRYTGTTAEKMIAQVLPLLLAAGVPIRGVSRGRSLEERVLELTV
jgi:ABC-type multidrug transport system ATPase subunit